MLFFIVVFTASGFGVNDRCIMHFQVGKIDEAKLIDNQETFLEKDLISIPLDQNNTQALVGKWVCML